jgi:hypothetical protein
MPVPFSLPKTALPELPGDLPCVVFYVDAAQKTVLDYRWSTVAEVLPTVVIVQENQKAAKGGAYGSK